MGEAGWNNSGSSWDYISPKANHVYLHVYPHHLPSPALRDSSCSIKSRESGPLRPNDYGMMQADALCSKLKALPFHQWPLSLVVSFHNSSTKHHLTPQKQSIIHACLLIAKATGNGDKEKMPGESNPKTLCSFQSAAGAFQQGSVVFLSILHPAGGPVSSPAQMHPGSLLLLLEGQCRHLPGMLVTAEQRQEQKEEQDQGADD